MRARYEIVQASDPANLLDRLATLGWRYQLVVVHHQPDRTNSLIAVLQRRWWAFW